MVIKASASAEIRPLVEALSGDDEVRREAAIARLAVIGERAVDRLVRAYRSASARDARVAILRALEAIPDPRSLVVARAAIVDGGSVGVAATAVLRSLADAQDAGTATEALDVLVATVLDRGAERPVRLAALEALRAMPEDVKAGIAHALSDKEDDPLHHEAAGTPADNAFADAVWADAVAGRLPDDPRILRELLGRRAQATPLTTLQKMVEAVREREGAVPERRDDWRAVRGSIHQALALRGSRVALYDLRESLAAPEGELPVSFLSALHVLGDESCLEPLAAAYARGVGSDWWRQQLVSAFRAIAKREKISARHALMKRIAARWPGVAAALAAN